MTDPPPCIGPDDGHSMGKPDIDEASSLIDTAFQLERAASRAASHCPPVPSACVGLFEPWHQALLYDLRDLIRGQFVSWFDHHEPPALPADCAKRHSTLTRQELHR